MSRLIALSMVLLPAPEGPATAVIRPPITEASIPVRISTVPTAYRSPDTWTLGQPSGESPVGLMPERKLEHLPAQVGVQTIVEGVGVGDQGVVVGKDKLHPPHDRVQ